SFMNLIPENTIDFLSMRKVAMIVSIALVAISLIVVPTMDPRGVELKGGDSLTIQAGPELTKQMVEESISDLDLGAEPIVQMQQPVGSDGELFLIRSPDNTADKIE